MNGYRRYRLHRLAIGLSVVGYLVLAVLLKPAGAIEFFPFFNWSLFSASSDRKTDVTLLVSSVDGVAISPPRLFYDMKDTFQAAQNRDPRLMKLLDKWAFAVLTHDTEASERLHMVVEKTFMSEVRAVRYELVVLKYNPLTRLKSGVIDETKSIGAFAKVEP